MSGQIWLWVLVVTIVLVAVVLLARRRTAGGAPAGDLGAGEAPAAEQAATPRGGTEPAEIPGQSGTVAEEPADATPDDQEPATTPAELPWRAPAVDSALAALDTGRIGRTGPNRIAGAAADAVSSVVAEARKGPHPGSALPNPDGYSPSPEFAIKANDGSKRFHDPDSPYYVRTRADLWFRTADDAERAGYSPWNARRTVT
ncbi:sunset domain-containing protein [Pseudonocardia bannensis]|uniref:Uncharacterized protein n=1 Tax=Pseudonocardia bannensis TaxID=630973 RepID=A0A848DP16_9PSEU|nr:hypothetical protein [Pseudonocardia bannensis]NMH94206.1 hypothetical protein [Pseudonocardia bannensis]